MNELFQNVLEASFHGGILIAVVALARLALKKAPKKYICLLWLLAALRLLMPFEIESAFSLQPDLTATVSSRNSQTQETIPLSTTPVSVENMVPAMPDTQEYPDDLTVVVTPNAVVEETHAVADYTLILSWVWLTVAAGMLLYSAVSYLRLRRRVGDAVILSEGVWVSGRIESPFVMGFFRPRIYLNPGLGEGDRAYVLAHERCHIRRGDHWWKWLGYITLAVHWFNPLVWLGYILLCRDLEMACDEAVVKEMEVGERKTYSAALLSCSAKGHTIAACPVAFGEVSVKGRIQNVLNYRKPKFWIVLIAILAVLIVGVCFLTSPVRNSLLELSGVSENQIIDITIFSTPGSTGISREKELDQAIRVLKEVTYDPEPVQEDTSGEDKWLGHQILLNCGDATWLLFVSQDFSAAWVEEMEEETTLQGERTPMYAIENPEPLRELLDDAFNGVSHRKTSGEPFATVEDIWTWAKNIGIEAVESASYNHDKEWTEENVVLDTSKQGALKENRFSELLEILNDLPEEAIYANGKEESLGYLSSQQMRTSFASKEGTSVTIIDGVNDLAVVLRYTNDTLELIVSEKVDAFRENSSDYISKKCYTVESETLMMFMRELTEYPDTIQYWGGYWENPWEEEILSAISGRSFTYEKDGFGGAFTITINADGTFSYYEGLLSSYIGMGNWTLGGDLLCLADEGMTDRVWNYYFKVVDDALVFQADISDPFLYIDVLDGERFFASGRVALQELTQEQVVAMCAAAYGKLHNAGCYYIQIDASYGVDSYQWKNGESSWYTEIIDSGWYDTLVCGEVYYRISQELAQNNGLPTGWIDQKYVEENRIDYLGSGGSVYFWEVSSWDEWAPEYKQWEPKANSLICEFTDKEDPETSWLLTLDAEGNLTSIQKMMSGRTVEVCKILSLDQAYIANKIALEYADAYRSVPNAVIVRDQAFYEELFTRQTDGHYTTTWISHLYEAFYAEPEEFARQLCRKFGEDPARARQVLNCMSYEIQWYEPERYLGILTELRKVTDLDQSIVDLLEQYYWEGEYRALGGSNSAMVTDSGQDYLAAALEGCEIIEGRHTQVSPESPYYYSFVACSVDADEEITALYQEQGYFDENTYAFSLEVIFVPGDHEWALVYCMAGNTKEYTGTDPVAPEGALRNYWCGYVTWTENGWTVEIVGTGW